MQTVGRGRLLGMRDSGSGSDGEDIYGSSGGKGCVCGREDVGGSVGGGCIDGGIGVQSIDGRAGLVNSAAAWSRLERLAVCYTSGDLATAA